MLKLWRGGSRLDMQGLLTQNMMRRPQMWSSKLFCHLLGIQSCGWSNVRYGYVYSISTWFLVFRFFFLITFLFVPLFFGGENAY
jgi:hypothetical protein